ncbi:hypothetical protein D3C76_1081940 [compost metagenome]
MGLHPQVQGFQALEEDPGVERAQGRPGGAQETNHLFHLLAATGHDAAHATTLAVDEFGGRVHDDVRAHFQRLLQRRGAEAVIDHQHRAFGVSDFRQFGNVHQLGQRVGRRFDEQQFGVGLDCRVPAGQVRQGHVIDFDTETLEVLLEQADGRAKHAARHQHVIAGAAKAHHHRHDRGHAGRGGHGLLGAFQRGNALFKGTHSRVGVARVDVARHFAGKTRGGIGGGTEYIAGSEEHRITVFAFRRTVLTGTYGQGIERYAFEVAVQPTGIPILTHAVTPFPILVI